jgi:hypothetical protein
MRGEAIQKNPDITVRRNLNRFMSSLCLICDWMDTVRRKLKSSLSFSNNDLQGRWGTFIHSIKDYFKNEFGEVSAAYQKRLLPPRRNVG